MLKFEEMPLSDEIIRAVADMGFEEATPIQAQSIEIIMSGRDVIGQSQTGTGKTAAFGIACIEKIDEDDKHLQAVILCPTRELAIQVCEEIRRILKYKDNIKVLPVYGGQPIDRQISVLRRGVQIIIGTPGRVMDHIERRTLRMDTVKMVILDEADEMLDMGFRDDIETILGKVPDERQIVLFSATMPSEILELTRKYQRQPEYIKVVRKELTVPNIEQVYFDVSERTKLEALCRVIDMYNPELSLIFCNTKKRVDELVEQLQGRGYFAEGLHGDLKQIQRDTVMKKFRNRTLEILVATDVAARGIDVDDIEIVFNYDLPQDAEYYVHRIGRTGRAGRNGKACTFIVGREIYKLRDIISYTKAKVVNQKLPTLSDIEQVKANNFSEEIKKTISEGHLSKYVAMVDNMISEDFSTIDIAAALIKMHLYDENSTDIDFDKFARKDYERGSGGKRPEKYEKKKKGRGEYNDENMVRLFINVGNKHKIKAKDVVGALAGETGIAGNLIGAIEIMDDFTFVDVPKDCVKEILSGMKNKKLKGNKVNVEQAQTAKKDKDKKKKKYFE
ncbi:RNA helicase [Clostridia bacterium]|nr:RNA helicase [Clostridia bacterium]